MKPPRAKQRNTELSTVESKPESVFSCEICAKNFQHKGSYTDHLKTHANYDVKYECAECPCFFKNAGHLSVHVREAHNKDPVKKVYDCKTCLRHFGSQQSLTEHKRRSHPSQLVIFNCKFCQRMYSSKNSLKWHINLNHNKDFKRSKCPYCPCDFKWPHHLKVHIRKAHIEKGHTPTDLLKNGLTSIRRKTNNCVVCQEKFEKKFDLMVHLKYVHKQELDIYKCCKCNAVFTLGNSLKLHLDEHRRNKSGFPDHNCDQCFPISAPKLYETEEKPEPKETDNRTDIEKEVIDFEVSLMENEDIRELIKYKIRHSKRPRRKRKVFKPDANRDFDEFYETYVDKNITIKNDLDTREPKSEIPVMNGKGKYYCEKCKLHFQMRFSYVTHLKDHTDTESQASTDTIEEINANESAGRENVDAVSNNEIEKPERVVKTNKTENKSPNNVKRNEAVRGKRKVIVSDKAEDIINKESVNSDIANTIEDKNDSTKESTENAMEKDTTDKSITAAGASPNISNDTLTAKMVLQEDNTESDSEDAKIDMEVRIKLPRLTNKELQNSGTNFECDICEHTFALECNLDEHVKLFHGAENGELPKRKAINSRYQCGNCNLKFTNPLALNRHQRMESKMKKLQIKKVPNKTKQLPKIKEVTFKCKMCKTGFTDRKRYATHVRLNHKEFEYSEPTSPKKSNVVPVSPRQLRKADKIYECGKCEIFFTSKLELLRHISDVHMYIRPKVSSPKGESTST